MQLTVLILLLAAFAAGTYVFRDGVGLVVFLVLGIATLVQLVRVATGNASSGTLAKLWAAFKDAFWGIG